MSENPYRFRGRWLVACLLGLFLVCGVTLVVLPYAMGHWIEHRLGQQAGGDISIADIDFNPFTGRFSISDLHVRQQGRELMVLPEAELRFAWWPMFRHQLVIGEIRIRGFELSVSMDKQQQWHVAGLPLAALLALDGGDGGWSVRIDRVLLGGRLHLQLPWYEGMLDIGSLQLFDLHRLDGGKPVRASLIARLGQASLLWNGSLDAFGEHPALDGQWQLAHVPLDTLRSVLGPWLEIPVHSMRATLDAGGKLHLPLDGGAIAWHVEKLHARKLQLEWTDEQPLSLQVASLTVSGLDQHLRMDDLNIDALSWRLGSAAAKQLAGHMDALHIARLTADDKGWTWGAWQSAGLRMQDSEWLLELEHARGMGGSWRGQLQLPGLSLSQMILELADKRRLMLASLELQELKQQQENWRIAKAKADHASWQDPSPDAALPRAEIEHLAADTIQLGAASAMLARLQAQSVKLGTDPQAMHELAAEIAMEGFHWQQRDWQLASLRMDEAALVVIHQARGRWSLAGVPVHLPGMSSKGRAPSWRIGQLELRQGQVDLKDRTVSPYYHERFEIKHVLVKDLGPRNHGFSPFFMRIVGEDRSRISIDGKMQPFARHPGLIAKAKVSSFSLASVSPFLIASVGYGARTGQFDGELTLSIVHGRLNGVADLHLRQLELVERDRGRAEQLGHSLSMPLDTALAMLRDDRGDITLEIPISGEITNPQFDYRDAINQALAKAMQKAALGYVAQLFQPYGALITLADLAYEAGKKLRVIRLAPVMFSPGTSEPDVQELQAYLDKVRALMSSKSALRLTICGRATAADAKALRARDEASDETALLNLADRRARRIRQLLLENYDLPPERLFLCQPDIDKEEQASARVDMLLR